MENHKLLTRKVAAVAKTLSVKYKARLDNLKANEVSMKRPDFLWHFLLQSFGTMGRAAGWDGLSKPENYNRVTYEALSDLPSNRRLKVAESACRDGKVRMPKMKAGYIVGCFDHVKELGGPTAAKGALFHEVGREAKIRFLKTFPGIGDKYGRNILMDVYHPDFRDSIAIDARIQAVSKHLGIAFQNYVDHEQFYLEAAGEAGLNGWELDRLMFHYLDEFRSALK